MRIGEESGQPRTLEIVFSDDSVIFNVYKDVSEKVNIEVCGNFYKFFYFHCYLVPPVLVLGQK